MKNSDFEWTLVVFLLRIPLVLLLVLAFHLWILGQLLSAIPSQTEMLQPPQLITVRLIKPSLAKEPQKNTKVHKTTPQTRRSAQKTQRLLKSTPAQQPKKKSVVVKRTPQKVTPTLAAPKNHHAPNKNIKPKSIIKKTAAKAPETTPQNNHQLSQSQKKPSKLANSASANTVQQFNGPQSAKGSSSLKNRPQQDSSFVPPSFQAAYLHNPAPAYPRVSKRRGEQGQVLLRVRVTPQGRAATVEIKQSSGSVRLDQSAQQTVRQWRFHPAQENGQAVSAWVIVPITFKLN